MNKFLTILEKIEICLLTMTITFSTCALGSLVYDTYKNPKGTSSDLTEWLFYIIFILVLLLLPIHGLCDKLSTTLD